MAVVNKVNSRITHESSTLLLNGGGNQGIAYPESGVVTNIAWINIVHLLCSPAVDVLLITSWDPDICRIVCVMIAIITAAEIFRV